MRALWTIHALYEYITYSARMKLGTTPEDTHHALSVWLRYFGVAASLCVKRVSRVWVTGGRARASLPLGNWPYSLDVVTNVNAAPLSGNQ